MGQIKGRYSEDHGLSWWPAFVIRDDFLALADDPDSKQGVNADIGYPRLIQRLDGKLVAMYYRTTAQNPQQHIAASIWNPQVSSDTQPKVSPFVALLYFQAQRATL